MLPRNIFNYHKYLIICICKNVIIVNKKKKKIYNSMTKTRFELFLLDKCMHFTVMQPNCFT